MNLIRCRYGFCGKMVGGPTVTLPGSADHAIDPPGAVAPATRAA